MSKTDIKVMNELPEFGVHKKQKDGESRLCDDCGCDITHHDVYPGGKCGGCHDKKTGFQCYGFNNLKDHDGKTGK